MKNIPVFTTQNGVATLILKEIPYYETAYIIIRDTLSPEELLAECKDFCRVVGAEHIYASGHSCLEKFPFHTDIFELSVLRGSLPDTDAALFPVTDETLEQWRAIYNEKMASVANASYMTVFDAKKMLADGHSYFVHEHGEFLGIGIASGDRIDAVAAVKKGRGRDCVLALNHALACEQIHLQVASSNFPAMKLYESLGFIKTSVISSWYQVL